jgi:uncharacterized protein (DUF305 family)
MKILTARTRMALATATLALTAALAGCAAGGNTVGMPGMDHGAGTASPGAGVPGDAAMADAMFTMMMIPHHEQAIEMSDTILAKADIDQSVLELAQQIKDAQAPEIELMQDWLDEWGHSSPADMGGMDHGDGMMSQDDMDALEAAEGDDAARLFLEQMIVHHEGAIEMAENELDQGADPEVLDLAQRIIDSQTSEIVTMKELLEQM